MFMTDELKRMISGWADIRPAWNDRKSQKMEEEVIFPLEQAADILQELWEQIENFARQVEETVEEIENMENTENIEGMCEWYDR